MSKRDDLINFLSKNLKNKELKYIINDLKFLDLKNDSYSCSVKDLEDCVSIFAEAHEKEGICFDGKRQKQFFEQNCTVDVSIKPLFLHIFVL